MLWLVGAGPGDADLLTRRAAELLREAAVVLAPVSLWPLARDIGSAVLQEPSAPTRWPEGDCVVRLYPGDAVAASTADRAALRAVGRPFDIVPGVAADAAGVVLEALGDDVAVRRPLRGRTLVVTRPAGQQASLAAPLRRWGARVVAMPTIAIAAPSDDGASLAAAVDTIDTYDWVVVTSVNGAEALLAALPDVRRLAGARLAAIGPATAAVLGAARLQADLVPETFVAEGLLAAFPDPPAGARPGRVLLARAEVARDTLPEGLRAAGWHVEVVSAYRTVAAAVPDDVRSAVAEADAVLFTSPSTVQRFVDVVGAERLRVAPPEGLVTFAIGPVTAAALERSGLRADLVAERYDVTGLLDAVSAWAAGSPAAPFVDPLTGAGAGDRQEPGAR